MNICVFCGSSSGKNALYKTAAKLLGECIARNNHTLVYGGGNVGLMGVLADAVLSLNGKVIGVIPDFLVRREVAHPRLTTLEVVSSMHERKKRMADLTDHFVAMPGGWGTLDELAEVLTWRQLGLINQPITLVNLNGYFDGLIRQMQTMVSEGFLSQSSLDQLFVVKDIEAIPGL